MKFVQDQIFSNSFSKDMVEILSATNIETICESFSKSKYKRRLEEVFTQVDKTSFISLTFLKYYSSENKLSFMSLEKSLAFLDNFSVKSTFYETDIIKENKLYSLLESMPFIESDIYLKLIRKDYDVKLIKDYLKNGCPKKGIVAEFIDKII